MMLHEQGSPIFFDIDSPYVERFRKLSTSSKETNKNFRIDLFPKTSSRDNRSNAMPSVQLQRIDSVRQQKDSPVQLKLKKRHSEQQKLRKIVFQRKSSEPQQITRQNTNPLPISSSNNQNVKKRLTSLERYFQETRSIQLPYRTQNRIHQKQKFLTQLQGFQANLSQAKKKDSKMEDYPLTERVTNGKRNRLSEARPKKLKINDLQNENVKKEKDKILVQKIMKQRITDYRQNIMKSLQEQKNKQTSFFNKPISLSIQIQNLSSDVEQMQMQIKLLRKMKKHNQQKMRQVSNVFGFSY